LATDRAGNQTRVVFRVTLDTSPPKIQWTNLPNPSLTNQSRLTLAGNVSEPATMTWDGKPIEVGSDLRFNITANLTEGVNEWTFVAKDRAGNETRHKIQIELDTQPPIMEYTGASDGQWTNKAQLAMSGRLNEAATLSLGKEIVPLTADLRFSVTTQLSQGSNKLIFVATDKAGNKAREEIRINLDTTAPTTPQVQDDGKYTTSAGSLKASWTPSQDQESGVVEYQAGLASVLAGQPIPTTPNLVDWKTVGSATSTQFDNLALSEGRVYYILVRAKNAAGGFSEIGISDGIIYLILRPPTINTVSIVQQQSVMVGDPLDISYVAIAISPQTLQGRLVMGEKVVVPWTQANPIRWIPGSDEAGPQRLQLEVKDEHNLSSSHQQDIFILRRPPTPSETERGQP